MGKVFLVLKLLYLLLPKFIRNQYDDTLWSYKNIVIKMINKLKISFEDDKYTIETLTLTLVSKIEELGCDFKILQSKKDRYSFINPPKILIGNENYFKSKLHGHVPDINIYSIEKVSVMGHTDAILIKDKFLHIELNFMENHHDLKRPDIFSKNDENNYTITVKHSNKPKSKKIHISLLKEHSINYFHWTTEALPRLILIIDTLKNKYDQFNCDEYILLLDEGLPKQCIDTIEIILQAKIEIIYIKKGEKVFCDKLIYCTPLWHSLDNTTGLPNPKKEFFIDKYALEIVREKVLTFYKNNSYTESYDFKKVYLQRLNNKLRPLINLNEVELLLFKNGFEFIDVGSLTLLEQLALFQNADIIAGVSGAAFTNLLYMKENAIAINFYPSASATNYYVFQPLADVSKVDLIHFLTIPKEGQTSVHAEASINLEYLEHLLKEL
jgi:hypothetical protein